jgi:hypothetical protein
VLNLDRPDVRTREGRVAELLNHWLDFFDPGGAAAGGGGVLMLPGMSQHPSVVELGRALEALQLFAPNKSAHLFAFYASPFRTWRAGRPVKGGRRVRGDLSDPSTKTWVHGRERVVPSWVREGKVRDGVRLIAQRPPGRPELRPWCFRGEVFLPAPLLERVQEEPRVAA